MTCIQAVQKIANRNPIGSLINHSKICMLANDMIIKSGERRRTECTIMRKVRESHQYRYVSPRDPENTTRVDKTDPRSSGYDGMYIIVKHVNDSPVKVDE